MTIDNLSEMESAKIDLEEVVKKYVQFNIQRVSLIVESVCSK